MSNGSLPDAIVLAGGSARRLGNVDKPGLYIGDATILDRALDALPRCGRVVVVGPERPTARDVVWTREEPAGAGPVAAIAAGLDLVTAPQVLVVAGDMPFLTSSVLSLLLRAMAADGALLVDDDGREQYLCSAWFSEELRSAVDGVTRVKDVVGRLAYSRVSVPAGLAAPWTDCDTPDELRAARELA
jgi:molybdopterin-guanine dinucleotide biosynthesis protein A